jgi:hypothetical protein
MARHIGSSALDRKNAKDAWIWNLRVKRIDPVMVLLEECAEEDKDQREAYWIDCCRAINPELTNAFPGKASRKIEVLEPSRFSVKNQGAVARSMGISRSVLGYKIQPIMYELDEAYKLGKDSADVMFDPAAIERWRRCLIDHRDRLGRGKRLDYRSLYLAWLEGHNK